LAQLVSTSGTSFGSDPSNVNQPTSNDPREEPEPTSNTSNTPEPGTTTTTQNTSQGTTNNSGTSNTGTNNPYGGTSYSGAAGGTMMNASSTSGAPTYASNSIGLLALYQPVAHQFGVNAAAFSVTQLPSNLTATQEANEVSLNFNNNYEDPVGQDILDDIAAGGDPDTGGNNNDPNNDPAGDAFSQDVAQALEEEGYSEQMQSYAANVAKGINDDPNLTEKQKREALESELAKTLGTEMARTIANNVYPKDETQSINEEGAMGGLPNPTI